VNRKLIVTTWLLSLALIVASAYMHLSNVGIGYGGSSGDYGVIEDAGKSGIDKAGELGTAVTAITPAAYPDRLHRGVANILEVLIVAVVVLGFMQRKKHQPGPSLRLPVLGLLVSLLLAFLGAWYGSPLRYPWIMILNLIGGYALFAIYWWLTMNLYPLTGPIQTRQYKLLSWVKLAFTLVVLQILLGAWTDAYYAAYAKPAGTDVTAWWSFSSLWQGLGLLGMLQVDGSGQVITDPAVAISIRTSHLATAIPVFIVTFGLIWKAWIAGQRSHPPVLLLGIILLAQLTVGLVMVWVGISLLLVVAHTVLAALIIGSLLTLVHRLQ